MTAHRRATTTDRTRWRAVAARALLAMMVQGCDDDASDVDATSPDAATPDAVTVDAPIAARDVVYAPVDVPPQGPDYDPARVGILRRLSNDEIRASWRDLLGSDESTTSEELLPDPLIRGFDTVGDALTISESYLVRYTGGVQRRVRDLTWARDVSPRLPTPCAPTPGDDTCLIAMTRTFGRRVFRRPLRTEEVARYAGLARLAEGNNDRAAQVVLAAMLQSPHFLFMTQASGATGSRLDGYSLAARLSYLLWSTTPPDALLDRAARGDLDTDEGYARVVTAMIDDPRTRAGMRRFFAKWLRLAQTAWVVRDMGNFPRWRPEYVPYLAEETTRFVDDIAWGSGANFLDLVSAQWTYVNAGLAGLYGVSAPGATGAAWVRAEFPPSLDRSGILTHASVLAITGGTTTAPSATRRGEYVRNVVLCEDVGSPPLEASRVVVPMMFDPRGRAAFYAMTPGCSTCHARLDPVGLGLERFDSTGALGVPASPTSEFSGRGRIEGFTPPEFTGAVELGARIRGSDQFVGCVTRQLFRFSLGRSEGDGDQAALDALTARFRASGYHFRELVQAMVMSEGFRGYTGATNADGGAP